MDRRQARDVLMEIIRTAGIPFIPLVRHRNEVNIENINFDVEVEESSRIETPKLVKLLIKSGANSFARDGCGKTPLHLAARGGNWEVVDILATHAAGLNESPIPFPLLVTLNQALAVNLGEYTNIPDRVGWTPLHLAANAGHVKAVNALLAVEAKPNLRTMDLNLHTALHLAALRGHAGVVDTLLRHGADPFLKDNLGFIPLDLAIREGHHGCFKLLEPDNLPPIDHEIKYLHLAAREGFSHIVDYLISCGKDPKARCTDGSTPLHLAAREGHVKVVKALIKYGADPEVQDCHGLTPFHLAARNGHYKAVVALYKNHMGKTERAGRTPLHLAVKEGNLDLVRALLKIGANPNARDRSGLTPLQIAMEGEDAKLIQALIDAGAVASPTPRYSLREKMPWLS